jgi:peptide/nickel transport system substrate-binding protein
MEKAVIDGKLSFSRSGATAKSVNWLSLIVPKDSEIIKENLQEYKNKEFIPNSLKHSENTQAYYENRYDSSIKWIEENNHAVISNGPFYLETYSPESRTITVKAFEDESYPFKIGKWSEFQNVQFPVIKKIDISKIIQYGESADILIETKNADSILYFLMDSKGKIQASEKLNVEENKVIIKITSSITKKLQPGANSVKVFAISNSVLKPDFYESSFLVSKNNAELPSVMINISNIENEINHNTWFISIVLITVIIGVIAYAKIKVNRNR